MNAPALTYPGLLKDSTGLRPLGFIFMHDAAAFAPSGKVDRISADEAKAHNAALEQAERDTMKATGRAVLYLSKKNDGSDVIQQWAGAFVAVPHSIRKSWHNMAGRDGRTDVSFSFAGSRWHGVNIGDNDILRCKRCIS